MRNPCSARTIFAPFLLLALFASGPRAAMIDGGRFGQVRLFESSGPLRSVVIVYGDARGWSAADDASARRLAAAGAVVAGVDLPAYLRTLASDASPCLYLVGDAEKLSRAIERGLRFPSYRSPILAGVGTGGALALAMLPQAPPSTLASIAAIDPAAEVHTSTPVCSEPPRDVGVPPSPDAEVSLIAFSGRALLDGQAATALKRASMAGLRPRVVPLLAAASPQESLASLLLLYALPAARSRASIPALGDLPLIEMPASPGAPLAVVLSGDGGWRDIDKEIAEELHRDGFSVLGWDSLRYFWQAKSPEILARDMSLALGILAARWHANRILLIGFSFGADVMPFAFNRLPSSFRKLVGEISLLGYGGRADFEIRVSGWLGASPSEAAFDAGPEVAKIDPRLVQCYYGSEESDSACPTLARTGAEVVRLDGGHHFGGHYPEISKRIAQGFVKRVASTP